MLCINGIDIEADGMSLQDFLIHNGYSIARIAVEINEKIIPKSDYATVILTTGDTVEIVSFVGGG